MPQVYPVPPPKPSHSTVSPPNAVVTDQNPNRKETCKPLTFHSPYSGSSSCTCRNTRSKSQPFRSYLYCAAVRLPHCLRLASSNIFPRRLEAARSRNSRASCSMKRRSEVVLLPHSPVSFRSQAREPKEIENSPKSSTSPPSSSTSSTGA